MHDVTCAAKSESICIDACIVVVQLRQSIYTRALGAFKKPYHGSHILRCLLWTPANRNTSTPQLISPSTRLVIIHVFLVFVPRVYRVKPMLSSGSSRIYTHMTIIEGHFPQTTQPTYSLKRATIETSNHKATR